MARYKSTSCHTSIYFATEEGIGSRDADPICAEVPQPHGFLLETGIINWKKLWNKPFKHNSQILFSVSKCNSGILILFFSAARWSHSRSTWLVLWKKQTHRPVQVLKTLHKILLKKIYLFGGIIPFCQRIKIGNIPCITMCDGPLQLTLAISPTQHTYAAMQNLAKWQWQRSSLDKIY